MSKCFVDGIRGLPVEAGWSVERFLQRTNQTNHELAGMKPEGEGEFGRRLEDTARTPIFWNPIDGRS